MPRASVLAFIDLVQDIDVLLPVLIGLKMNGVRTQILVSHWLREASPRTLDLLKAHDFKYVMVDRPAVMGGKAPGLAGVKALLTASESGADAHLAAHTLARRAAALGIPAYCLQHGLQIDAAEHASGASRYFLAWGEGAATDAAGPERLAVGRPMLPTVGGPVLYDVGVFENLHWGRYDDTDRARFLDGLMALAAARPQLSILVRSHPAAGWLDGRVAELARFGQIVIEPSLVSRTRRASGAAVVASCARVITTPSTVALDAAMANRPVALVGDGGESYRPLPVLKAATDWIAFADSPPAATAAGQALVKGAVVEGDAVSRIVALFEREFAA